jgi:hypothetical protein
MDFIIYFKLGLLPSRGGLHIELWNLYIWRVKFLNTFAIVYKGPYFLQIENKSKLNAVMVEICSQRCFRNTKC